MLVRSNQYSLFGKNKKAEGEGKDPPTPSMKDREVFESPHQQAIAKSTPAVVDFKNTSTAPVDSSPDGDGIPF